MRVSEDKTLLYYVSLWEEILLIKVMEIGRDRILDTALPTSREKSTVLFHRYSTYRTVIEIENHWSAGLK